MVYDPSRGHGSRGTYAVGSGSPKSLAFDGSDCWSSHNVRHSLRHPGHNHDLRRGLLQASVKRDYDDHYCTYNDGRNPLKRHNELF